ncbi:MAG: BolA family transcriptional regulator [Burkholderiales bacterium]|nr:BolA family transcriptional regulator [Burkholderiales bacterium]
MIHAEQIDAALRSALQPESLQVIDDSHLHVGHAGAREGRHFTVRLSCAAFAGKPRVARHRLVYDALASLIPQGIHALAIDARAPGEPGSSPPPADRSA